MQEVNGRQAPLAVTMGDPAGIGMEITCKAWAQRNEADIPVFALFGDANAARTRARELNLDVPFSIIERLEDAAAVFPGAVPVIEVPLQTPAVPGRPDSRNGSATITAIERATAAVIDGSASALVTNPIAKNVLYEAGFKHPGHTEYLAFLADRAFPGKPHRPVMMLAAAELRVVPLTIHVPLAAVPGLISRDLILDTVRIMHEGLIRDFGIQHPRIAVAGLNPHAGEAGTIGREDETIIRPAIATLVSEGLTVTGPHSADTLFHDEARETYDAVLAMYHDQALIPIKTLAFDRGVNMTLGLPFIRTSPDHGTAFDIAGRGIARPVSFIEALRVARDASLRRATTASAS